MRPDDTTPMISKTAFDCPHCGAYTTQFWHKTFVSRYDNDSGTPPIPTQQGIERVEHDPNVAGEKRANLLKWAKKMVTGRPYIESSEESGYNKPILNNCNVTRCYNCQEITIWVHDRIVYPTERIAIEANLDLPDRIKLLFDEARSIVADSPKGAAALLRLCVQYLCVELGQPGKHLDSDIAALVANGLNPVVQQSLDVVRVIGNESVHPGEINLNDDRETAVKLFGLVNLIAEQMISHPKQVKALYDDLPEKKLEGIERRNKRALDKTEEEQE